MNSKKNQISEVVELVKELEATKAKLARITRLLNLPEEEGEMFRKVVLLRVVGTEWEPGNIDFKAQLLTDAEEGDSISGFRMQDRPSKRPEGGTWSVFNVPSKKAVQKDPKTGAWVEKTPAEWVEFVKPITDAKGRIPTSIEVEVRKALKDGKKPKKGVRNNPKPEVTNPPIVNGVKLPGGELNGADKAEQAKVGVFGV